MCYEFRSIKRDAYFQATLDYSFWGSCDYIVRLEPKTKIPLPSLTMFSLSKSGMCMCTEGAKVFPIC